MNWRLKRQIIIVFILLLVTGVFGTGAYFAFFYQRANCNDGLMNGAETGVDCGGMCAVMCSSEVKPLDITFIKSFEVTPSLYHGVALLENKNTFVGSKSFAYTLTLRDSGGIIAERKGESKIPVEKRFAIFESNIETNGRKPTETILTITREPVWRKDIKKEPKVNIVTDPIMRGESNPIVNARVTNADVSFIGKTGFVVIIYDDAGNPIATSRTFVEGLALGEQKSISFTWPKGYTLGTQSCDINAPGVVSSFVGDVMLVLDRSGSMASIKKVPPEPLTSVKEAAKTFARFIKGDDRVGVVSFATEATLDRTLTKSGDDVESAIDGIYIGTGSIQQTNIGDGLLKALDELMANKRDTQANIVLLTDGVATRPLLEGDEEYPNNYAQEISRIVRDSAIGVYTIGLGSDVDADFLKTISTNENAYYSAASADDLGSIYNKIAQAICSRRPAVVEIISQSL